MQQAEKEEEEETHTSTERGAHSHGLTSVFFFLLKANQHYSFQILSAPLASFLASVPGSPLF